VAVDIVTTLIHVVIFNHLRIFKLLRVSTWQCVLVKCTVLALVLYKLRTIYFVCDIKDLMQCLDHITSNYCSRIFVLKAYMFVTFSDLDFLLS
jgi:hypothetical protein